MGLEQHDPPTEQKNTPELPHRPKLDTRGDTSRAFGTLGPFLATSKMLE